MLDKKYNKIKNYETLQLGDYYKVSNIFIRK
jgi:hypothetical protein